MKRWNLLFLVLIFTAHGLHAQNGPGDTGRVVQKNLSAARLNSSITVDGVLDEPSWQQAPVASGFRQFEPVEGAAATFPSQVRVLYDDRAIYIGAVLYDDAPEQIKQMFTRRDDIAQVNYFWVSLDSQLDRKTAYTFAVSAAGVQADGIITNHFRRGGGGGPGQGQGPFDTSWDAVWYSKTRVTPEGWVVEMEIPLSMLRFSHGSTDRWGVNFYRNIQRLSEVDEWEHIPRSVRDYVANYGELEGVQDLAAPRNIQVIPYSLSKRGSGADSAATPSSFDVGSDFKIGLGSNVTLDATINPDFGQVESDPAVLNLTTFETIYPEKRPFFMEGADIFNFRFPGRDGEMLYTRRIGGTESPIIGATKLTGRTNQDLAFGVLGAATGQQFSPDHYFLAGRLRRDFSGTSYLGGMVTGFQEESGGQLQKQSVVGGVDFNAQFGDEQYEAQGFAAFSNIRDHEDSTTAGLNPRTGFTANFEIGRIAGNWTYSSRTSFYDDKFNTNDAGHLRQNDLIQSEVHFGRLLNDNQPFGPFRRAEIGGFLGNVWAYSTGLNRGFGGIIHSSWELNSFQTFRIDLDPDDLGGYDVRETRGLGPYKNPGAIGIRLGYESDSRKEYQITPRLEISRPLNGGRRLEARFRGRWNMTSRISLQSEIQHTRTNHIEAWMANEPVMRNNGTWFIGPSNTEPADVGAGEFMTFPGSEALDPILGLPDGSTDYIPIFGRRTTREFSFQLRGDIAFGPTLSLQLFGQLFVARGKYVDAGVLTEPDRIEPFPAYPKSYDFSLHSYIHNAVLRWEYRPGSTLYLVWSQSRRADTDSPLLDPNAASPYNTTLPNQVGETFNLYPDNVLMLKVDYTFLW